MRGFALANLGMVMGDRTRRSEQVEFLEQAVAVLQLDPGTTRYDLAGLQNALGNAYRANGRDKEAIEALDASVEDFVEAVGEHHQRVATARLARSWVLANLGRTDEARADIIAARDVFEAIMGPDHPRFGLANHYLATHYWRQEGRLDQAYALYGRALEIYRRSLQSNHPYIVFALNGQGSIRLEQDRLDEALAHFEEALSLARGSFAPDHQQIRYANSELGRLYHRKGELARARQFFDAALEHVPRDGTFVEDLEPLLVSYAELLDELGEVDKAGNLRREAAALRSE